MKPCRFAAVVVSLLALAPLSVAQSLQKPGTEKYDLRPKFKVGQETRLQMDMDVNGKQATPSAGESSLMQQKVGALLHLKCKDTNPETGSTLEMQFETLKIKATTPLGNIDFDSTKTSDPEDITGEAIRSIMMTQLTVKMDPSGNITSVDGGGGGAGSMGMMGGPDMIKDLLKNAFGPITTSQKGSGRYAIGESWKNEDIINGGLGTMRSTTTNTLKGVSSGIAHVDVKGAVTLDPSSAAQGISIRDSSIKGDFNWDTEAGMLDSMNMTQRYSIEQKQGGGQPVRTSQDVTMKVSRVRTTTPIPHSPPPGGLVPPKK
jgi:hypothetical protein